MTASSIQAQARIVSHLPRVRALAARLAARTGGGVAAEDLAGAGAVGLVEAAARFDAGQGVPFEVFVHGRVQGAMLDVMRAGDHLSRRARQEEREAAATERRQRPGDAGGPRALPHRLAVVSLEEAGELPCGRPTPFDEVARGERLARMRSLIEALPARERLILSLYYERELTYREIGLVVGVSESRICQVLRGAQTRLRKGLARA